MSDTIVKIIPCEYAYQMTVEEAEYIMLQLRQLIQCDEISYRVSSTPQFVDCGTNLDRISCPICGSLAEDWWGKSMNYAYESSSFVNLDVITPCCGQKVSLNDLVYDFDCGFSCVEFDVRNPHSEVRLEKIQDRIRLKIKIIKSHI